MKVERVLISVHDKRDLAEMARFLAAHGIEILSGESKAERIIGRVC